MPTYIIYEPKKTEGGFRVNIPYPRDVIRNIKGITLPKEQFLALCTSLSIKPENKIAKFAWSDEYAGKGFYLYQHDHSYFLLTINLEDQQ